MPVRVFTIGAALALAAVTSGLAQQPAKMSQEAAKQPAAATTMAAKAVDPAMDPTVARRITIDEVKKHIDAGETVYIIDNRSSFTGPMIKGAAHVPLAKIDEWSKQLPKDAMIVGYCTCGAEQTSMAAVLKLQERGFTNAYALKGGLTAWQTAGLPTESQQTAAH